MEEKKSFIALCDENFGVGSSLEDAYEELQIAVRDNVDMKDIVFFEAKKLKVELKFEIQDE